MLARNKDTLQNKKALQTIIYKAKYVSRIELLKHLDSAIALDAIV